MNRTYVVLHFYEDQYPDGTDLKDTAWEALVAHAEQHELQFNSSEVWVSTGLRWKSDGHGFPLVPTQVHGVRIDVHMIPKAHPDDPPMSHRVSTRNQ